jgi:hypothetical protein
MGLVSRGVLRATGWHRPAAFVAALANLMLAVVWGASAASAASPATPTAPVVHAVLFWMDGCGHCDEAMKEVLPPLQRRHGERLDIRLVEISDPGGADLYWDLAEALEILPEQVAVPLLVVGDEVMSGTDAIRSAAQGVVDRYLADGGVSYPAVEGADFASMPAFADRLPPETADSADGAEVMPGEAAGGATDETAAKASTSGEGGGDGEPHLLDVPLVGMVDLDDYSLVVSTLLIGFIDGVNPCSLWVLTLLLAIVISSGSRRRTVAIGLTFLGVAGVVYALAIVGMFSAFAVIGYAFWVRVAVAAIATVFAVVNTKDYFWYKQGLSFTIADEQKPGIYHGIRPLMRPDMTGVALVGATATMAAGVTLVELPCTVGLPLLWTKLISSHEVSTAMFAFLLALYMLMCALDELVVFIMAVVTLRAVKMKERGGRILKLVGGTVMLALALVLLVKPTLMDSVRSSVIVFGAAGAVALLVLVVHRRLPPRFGVYVGSGWPARDADR